MGVEHSKEKSCTDSFNNDLNFFHVYKKRCWQVIYLIRLISCLSKEADIPKSETALQTNLPSVIHAILIIMVTHHNLKRKLNEKLDVSSNKLELLVIKQVSLTFEKRSIIIIILVTCSSVTIYLKKSKQRDCDLGSRLPCS
uniref:Uncharacterized protein n=1 Tax=Rhizophagus irregularis (strain DAOM 181602 / DAOM 197198 / MUCL 43194) TaxID=747089 RepID=U9TMT0_RHIID